MFCCAVAPVDGKTNQPVCRGQFERNMTAHLNPARLQDRTTVVEALSLWQRIDPIPGDGANAHPAAASTAPSNVPGCEFDVKVFLEDMATTP